MKSQEIFALLALVIVAAILLTKDAEAEEETSPTSSPTSSPTAPTSTQKQDNLGVPDWILAKGEEQTKEFMETVEPFAYDPNYQWVVTNPDAFIWDKPPEDGGGSEGSETDDAGQFWVGGVLI